MPICSPLPTMHQWKLHCCAFIVAFTVVMNLLVISTDFRGRQFTAFNTTIIWSFEEIFQDSPVLIELIRKRYIEDPLKWSDRSTSGGEAGGRIIQPLKQLIKILNKKEKGIFIECGANGQLSDATYWLERALNWSGLATQPHPVEYVRLKRSVQRAHTAQVCISPIFYPRHGYFRNSSTSTNATLNPVPCFPLYSLIRAFSNASRVDLLVLNNVNAPLQVLKTLPPRRIDVRIISLAARRSRDWDDVCCSESTVRLLERWGYRRSSPCQELSSSHSRKGEVVSAGMGTVGFEPCYFVCMNNSMSCPTVSLAKS